MRWELANQSSDRSKFMIYCGWQVESEQNNPKIQYLIHSFDIWSIIHIASDFRFENPVWLFGNVIHNPSVHTEYPIQKFQMLDTWIVDIVRNTRLSNTRKKIQLRVFWRKINHYHSLPSFPSYPWQWPMPPFPYPIAPLNASPAFLAHSQHRHKAMLQYIKLRSCIDILLHKLTAWTVMTPLTWPQIQVYSDFLLYKHF